MTNKIELHLNGSLPKTRGKNGSLSRTEEEPEVYRIGYMCTFYMFIPKSSERMQIFSLGCLFSGKYTPGICSRNLPTGSCHGRNGQQAQAGWTQGWQNRPLQAPRPNHSSGKAAVHPTPLLQLQTWALAAERLLKIYLLGRRYSRNSF